MEGGKEGGRTGERQPLSRFESCEDQPIPLPLLHRGLPTTQPDPPTLRHDALVGFFFFLRLVIKANCGNSWEGWVQ